MIWDNFSIFMTNCAILTSYIRADPHVGGSRVDVVTLRDQVIRVERFSCVFFTAMAGTTNQGLICSVILRANGKGGFFRVENKTLIVCWE